MQHNNSLIPFNNFLRPSISLFINSSRRRGKEEEEVHTICHIM
jgi:hypothetical protein